MKLKNISFRNYKVFANQESIELKPLTVLIGKNSSGKSSIAKLLTLIEGSLSQSFSVPLLLTQDGVDLGNQFRNLIHNQDPSTPLDIKLKFSDNTELIASIIQPITKFIPIILYWSIKTDKIDFSLSHTAVGGRDIYTDRNGKEFLCEFQGIIPNSIIDLSKNEPYYLGIDFSQYKITVDYLGPFRLYPPRYFSLSGMSIYKKMGIKGENAYEILGLSKLNQTPLIDMVGKWFKNHFNGWSLDVNIKKYPFLEIVLTKENKPADFEVNIADVGQGMSQALPSVVRAFLPEKDTLIVLEQPELHLHPAAHGDLAELFAESAINHNYNYLIETHSESFILRLRALIPKGKIKTSDFVIYYIDDDGDANTLKEIKIDEMGEVDFWPKGIFSETYEEVKALGQAQYEKKASKE
jgi:predicted ATPase